AVLVPTRAGTYRIGPVKFAWFDTRAGEYRIEPVPAITVTIQPAAPPPESAATPTPDQVAPGTNEPSTREAARELPPDLMPPVHLPRDPLEGHDNALAPRRLAWWWWFPLALGLPALFWIALAWRVMWR